jgi:GNAT superfamily N-acetyltransferase
MKVAPATVEEIRTAPNLEELVSEYAHEVRIADMPWPRVEWPIYQGLERAGALHVFAARNDDGTLIGFVVMIVSMMPEYGVRLACTEAFFVAQASRGSGAGLQLLMAADAKAREVKAPGLAVSAPLGGKLAEVLPKCGFREIGRTFFKRYANGSPDA